ncbi:hypothetical protein BDB00DRAFT_850388 [Zychaea mexicana]|uniref:uncharacterized protein n=1 Tax=Zychaea mexicana TaxID=64656 RepID=UPI0022FE2140|nr:uncharacterized protein BDB00DRAFT_850388 [Zychaea mexicana]KAI9488031.1 hypothetical protein BDB00DRAFT_850388 [Zychaea mexicana]
MIKNLGKLKQWTGERLGAAKSTLQTEDFQRLEADTERKRTGFERVYSASELTYSQLSKKKLSPEDGKTKVYPCDALGSCLMNHGGAFTEDSPLGAALVSFGQAESRIAVLQEDFSCVLKEDYMSTLEAGLQEYKEYQALKKKLESRRLDYDSKLGRLQKAKKEKPELEQEMQASKLKYEETEYDLIQKMVYLQEFEDTHYETLRRLLEAQYMYYSRAAELLDGMRANWGQGGNPMARPVTRSATTFSSSTVSTPRSFNNNSNSNMNGGAGGDDYFAYSESPDTQTPARSPGSALSSIQRRLSTRQGSADSLNVHPAGPRRVSSSTSIRSSTSERSASTRQPPPMPRRNQQATTKRRKAMYDFEGESIEELSFRAGDVITVVEEVDEGWWLGEVEHFGPKRRGIFPVNYTEDIVGNSNNRSPPMPARPSIPPAASIQEQPDEEDEPMYSRAVENDSPFSDHAMTGAAAAASVPSTPAYEQPRPFATRSNSASTMSSPPPASRSTTYVPLDTKPMTPPSAATASTRTPPPPPASRMSPSVSTSSSTRTPPPPPQAHARALASVTPAGLVQQHDNEPPCQECGCTDFSANVFKKGHCKTCFHKHQ